MLVEFSIFALDSIDGLLFAEFFAGSGVASFTSPSMLIKVF